jgi:ATP-dependent helicase HrpB
VPLYGALEAEVQDRAIAPSPPGRRKVVLATSIAETSLTIEGVRVVVDSGLARVPRFEPAVGLTRLETARVSRASADQRRGRAGRVEPGVCYRLWDEPETRSLLPFAQPEILAADLSGLLLDLAAWGVPDPIKLAWLDPPPAPALAEAGVLLRELGAIDAAGRITMQGERFARLPLPPRLAAMIVAAANEGEAALAAEIAAVVSERGLGGDDVDLSRRIENFRRDRSQRAEGARRLVRRWAESAGGKIVEQKPANAGALLALAFPDRVAKARPGRRGAFLLENGRGAALDPTQALAREPYLAVAELAGAAAEARILLAVKISEAEIERRFASHIEDKVEAVFDEKAMAVRGRASRRLGALALAERPIAVKPSAETARALGEGIVRVGLDRLPWTPASRQWIARVRFLRGLEGEPWPDLSDDALRARIDEWLVPTLGNKTTLADLSGEELSRALRALLPHSLARRLEQEAPTHFAAPTGSTIAVDYAAEGGPMLAVKVQELFGLGAHPKIAGGRVPLAVSLLSPAGQPIQVTKDLPAFWRGSWAEVKREMRGRYPKHPWPDDPLAAAPTRRAKPRAR